MSLVRGEFSKRNPMGKGFGSSALLKAHSAPRAGTYSLATHRIGEMALFGPKYVPRVSGNWRCGQMGAALEWPIRPLPALRRVVRPAQHPVMATSTFQFIIAWNGFRQIKVGGLHPFRTTFKAFDTVRSSCQAAFPRLLSFGRIFSSTF